jgi:hypothetical protein
LEDGLGTPEAAAADSGKFGRVGGLVHFGRLGRARERTTEHQTDQRVKQVVHDF